ncbi:hypothetical protein FCV85_08040 [Vibrio sp. F13]|uniref:hypothetical protein n=1 Tax=unclassified Vibrio TaxID=2614977 RepID=UPI0010BD4667|nr:hypothetical protein [Vibrio sp. F13]TKG33804.1 hypothetical protein FCV85_08040 [Vibrio sp. F13]
MSVEIWDIKDALKGFDPRDYEGFLYYVWFPDIDYYYIGIMKYWTKDGDVSPWMYYTTSNKDAQRLITEGQELSGCLASGSTNVTLSMTYNQESIKCLDQRNRN